MKNTTIISKEEIKQYLQENEDIFNETFEELESYCGYGSDDRYYDMEMLQDFYSNEDPVYILERAYYGYDEESWTLDSYGEKHYGAFNPNRAYFRYNGYGNLVSADYKDYSANLDDYFIDKLIEEKDSLYLNDKLMEMLENCEEVNA